MAALPHGVRMRRRQLRVFRVSLHHQSISPITRPVSRRIHLPPDTSVCQHATADAPRSIPIPIRSFLAATSISDLHASSVMPSQNALFAAKAVGESPLFPRSTCSQSWRYVPAKRNPLDTKLSTTTLASRPFYLLLVCPPTCRTRP